MSQTPEERAAYFETGYWDLTRENRRLGDLLRTSRKASSRRTAPEWAEGQDWDGWSWDLREQRMVIWCELGMLAIDEEGCLLVDKYDDWSSSESRSLELCNVALCKRVADLIIAEYPNLPDADEPEQVE